VRKLLAGIGVIAGIIAFSGLMAWLGSLCQSCFAGN